MFTSLSDSYYLIWTNVYLGIKHNGKIAENKQNIGRTSQTMNHHAPTSNEHENIQSW
jgi:hypothetical protein